jgi:hypothetical protein
MKWHRQKKPNPRKEYARAKEEVIHAGGELLKKVVDTALGWPCSVCDGCEKHPFLCPYIVEQRPRSAPLFCV